MASPFDPYVCQCGKLITSGFDKVCTRCRNSQKNQCQKCSSTLSPNGVCPICPICPNCYAVLNPNKTCPSCPLPQTTQVRSSPLIGPFYQERLTSIQPSFSPPSSPQRGAIRVVTVCYGAPYPQYPQYQPCPPFLCGPFSPGQLY